MQMSFLLSILATFLTLKKHVGNIWKVDLTIVKASWAKPAILASIPNYSNHNIPPPPFKATPPKHMNALPDSRCFFAQLVRLTGLRTREKTHIVSPLL